MNPPMQNPFLRVTLAACTTLLVAACSGETADKPKDAATPPTGATNTALPGDLFVTTAPSGAVDVRQAIDSAKAGDDITVRGVIGGRKVAFVEGRAMMLVIDPALTSCADEEGCPTPWDYCCTPQEDLVANTMTVQVVGDDGRPIATSLQGQADLIELATVVVEGVVRSNEGSLVLDARRIHLADAGPMAGRK